MTQISLAWGYSSGDGHEHQETEIPDLTQGAHPCPGGESQAAEPGKKTAFYESNAVFGGAKTSTSHLPSCSDGS